MRKRKWSFGRTFLNRFCLRNQKDFSGIRIFDLTARGVTADIHIFPRIKRAVHVTRFPLDRFGGGEFERRIRSRRRGRTCLQFFGSRPRLWIWRSQRLRLRNRGCCRRRLRRCRSRRDCRRGLSGLLPNDIHWRGGGGIRVLCYVVRAATASRKNSQQREGRPRFHDSLYPAARSEASGVLVRHRIGKLPNEFLNFPFGCRPGTHQPVNIRFDKFVKHPSAGRQRSYRGVR